MKSYLFMLFFPSHNLILLLYFLFFFIHIEMSAGDITRLNRMYNCPNTEATIKSSTQFTNGPAAAIKRVELHKTKDNTSKTTIDDDLQKMASNVKDEMNLNPNDTLTNDDDAEDDMVLSKEQIDALFSVNAAKRNGLKSAFHHWPSGRVAFEIDPTFRKDFFYDF
jgi:hypothetical protein